MTDFELITMKCLYAINRLRHLIRNQEAEHTRSQLVARADLVGIAEEDWRQGPGIIICGVIHFDWRKRDLMPRNLIHRANDETMVAADRAG